jgi:hypothetical protein
MDKTILAKADTSTQIEAALECCRQQAVLLNQSELSEQQLEQLHELEQIRSYIVRLIQWDRIRNLDQLRMSLEQLQSIDADNRALLTTRRDELRDQIELLKKRRNVAGEYLAFR